jgi:hypothetical protein
MERDGIPFGTAAIGNSNSGIVLLTRSSGNRPGRKKKKMGHGGEQEERFIRTLNPSAMNNTPRPSPQCTHRQTWNGWTRARAGRTTPLT